MPFIKGGRMTFIKGGSRLSTRVRGSHLLRTHSLREGTILQGRMGAVC